MKRIFICTAVLLAAGSFVLLDACHKKEEAPPPPVCKTCKATGVDGTIQKQVCSDAEEAAFRSANAGKQITCQ